MTRNLKTDQHGAFVGLIGPTMDDICELVAKRFRVSVDDLRGRNLERNVSRVRQVAIYLTRELTMHKLWEIGGFYGLRDHSTILYAIERAQKSMDEDPRWLQAVNQIAHDLRIE